ALEFMRADGVVHRDLKPTNIMLCRDGTLRLMDFGLASGGAGRRVTFMASAAGIGTVEYMAPEQLKGAAGDHRMDVYSLGAILYEMATGHVPYDEQPDLYSMMNARLVGDPVAPRAHNPALSPELEEVILHAIERDPCDRYQSAAELRRELADSRHVVVTGRAQRLVTPRVPSRNW